MKYSLILLVLFVVSSVSANSNSLQGYSSVNAAVAAFLNPLKSGVDGVPESIASLSGTDMVSVAASPSPTNSMIANSATAMMKAAPVNGPLQSTFTQLMRTEGNLKSYILTGQQLRLGGKMVKLYYDLYFTQGPMKQIVFTVMQPTMTGGFFVRDTQISDPAPTASPTSN
jgi:hypothetical protein